MIKLVRKHLLFLKDLLENLKKLQINDFSVNKYYADKVDNTVDECNNAYPGTIKMKHVDIKSSVYIDFNEKIIKKVFKFKISDYMKDMFQIGKIFFVINKFLQKNVSKDKSQRL